MKRILKRIGIAILLLLVILISIPFLFQSQIKEMIKNYINDQVNAKVEFADASLSLIKNFPNATITIDELSIVNHAPFENDTLASVSSIGLKLSLSELFGDAMTIDAIAVDQARIQIKTNADGQSNYDIAKETAPSETSTSTSTESSGFAFNLEDYSISNSRFLYSDATSAMTVILDDFNHSGNGSFTDVNSALSTKTSTLVSLEKDSTKYLNNNSFKLDAVIGLNLKDQIYTFKDNRAHINQLALEFDGFVQLLETGQNIDISFKNPGSSFKDFLALIPEAYMSNLEGVDTQGDFTIDGFVKGTLTETQIPTFDINIQSKDASFKFAELPKRVEHITIDTHIKNSTGKLEDSYLDLKNLSFAIDKDQFKASAVVKDFTGNMLVDAHLDGVLNLEHISEAYPVTLENELTGLLKAKLHTNFDMNALETNAYERIKNDGDVQLSGFEFSSKDIVNPIKISDAHIVFDPNKVTLDSFKASSGTSDFSAKGTLDNILGFLLSNKTLQGDFAVNSNRFAVSDFMVEGGTTETETPSATEPETTSSEPLKIPAFLDCKIQANVQEVIYDNLELKKVKGILILKDEKAEFKELSSDIFNGKLTISGVVNTQNDTPLFDMNLNASQLNIAQSFQQMDLLKTLVPVAEALQGKLNGDISLSGALTKEYTPDLSSISGDALAELLSTTITPKNTALFQQLDTTLPFLNLKQLNLNDIKTHIAFEDGKVAIKPFNVKYKDIDIAISGSHGFDQKMNYQTVFHVPAKYLGSEVQGLLSQIKDPEAKNITVPVTANIGGAFTKPTIKTDLSQSVTNLSGQLLEIKKKQLLGKGGDLLNNLLNTGDKPKDSTQNNNSAAESLFNSLLGGKKKKKKKTNQ